MAQRLKHMFLSTLAASWLISGVCAQASSANEFVQAATCGSAQSTFFQTNVNAFVTLDRKGTKDVVVRHLRIDSESNSWSSGDIRVSPTLDCSALN